MKVERSISMVVGFILAAPWMMAQAHGQRIIKYDAPDAGKGASQGTTTTSINILGIVTGLVTDRDNGTHGFVGIPGGEITNFDVRGADPAAGGTEPAAISDFGVIIGDYYDANSASHGFVRSPDGKIVRFDVDQAGTGAAQGTYPEGINDLGEGTGTYLDANNVYHGFVRGRDGRITLFDDAEAGTGAYLGTNPFSINNFGVVTGVYYDADGIGHGFLRAPDGRTISFDVPLGVGGAVGVYTAFLNDFGVVGGSFYDAKTNVETGYVRAPGGRISTFLPPDSGTTAYSGANVYAIGLNGSITGFTADNNDDAHAFIRFATGKSITFSIPGQVQGAGNDYGSAGWAINAQGVVAGRWRDTHLAIHGFIWVP